MMLTVPALLGFAKRRGSTIGLKSSIASLGSKAKWKSRTREMVSGSKSWLWLGRIFPKCQDEEVN